jgi:hypothetical protein
VAVNVLRPDPKATQDAIAAMAPTMPSPSRYCVRRIPPGRAGRQVAVGPSATGHREAEDERRAAEQKYQPITYAYPAWGVVRCPTTRADDANREEHEEEPPVWR